MEGREPNDDSPPTVDTNSSWDTVKQYFKEFNYYTNRIFDVENQRLVAGLNSGIVAAFITTSYRTRVLTLVPRVLVPPICGIVAAISWDYLITKKLATKELDCPACTSIRGFTIAVTSAAILPLCIGGVLIARRSIGLFAKAERFTENFGENLLQRPILVAAVLLQGCAGWIMGSREFEKTFIEKLYRDRFNN